MTTDVDLPSDKAALARADFVSQTTAIEQARAVAEVQAAIIVAQQCPRDTARAVAQMVESCSQTALAERAFYSYNRGGSTVAGASVQLARELARVWGNVQYGINELRRDDEAHYSEMQAWAWDVETNTRSSQTFVVPHRRDTRDRKGTLLVDLRDVYENNANMGARRLREAVFSILPAWFTARAEQQCTKTLAEGGGKPMAERIATTLTVFAEQHGVAQADLEGKIGRKASAWTPIDLAQLHVLHTSLNAGTVTIEEAFPQQRMTAAEITDEPTTPKSSRRAKASEPPALDDATDAAWVDDAKGAS